MLQPKVVADLELKRYGYKAYPLDPAYAAMTPDGPIIFHDDVVKTQESIARFSKKDAEAYGKFEELLFMAADFVRPMMIRNPPAPGSKAPADVAGLLKEAGRVAGMSQRDVQQLIRIFTMSVGDWLDSLFENDYLKGSIASTGVVGVWAGPYSPGTAYNLLHHALGELDGQVGSWGQVVGGMGAISEAIAASARSAGAEIRTDAEVVSIDSAGGRVTGVTLADGTVHRAPIVASGAHPKTTILDLAGGENFPDEIREDMEAYRTRGASVKINMVLSEAPGLRGPQRGGLQAPAHGRRQLVPVARLPRARLAGRGPRRARREPVRRDGGPLLGRPVADRRRPLDRDDVHPVRADRARAVAGGLAREVRRHLRRAASAEFATNLEGAILEREVLAPPDLEDIFGLVDGSIFQGEQDIAQMAFMRPTPGLAKYSTPLHGLYLCGAGTHPGGGVMAASGHNAAQRILKDRRREGGLRGRLARRRTTA